MVLLQHGNWTTSDGDQVKQLPLIIVNSGFGIKLICMQAIWCYIPHINMNQSVYCFVCIVHY